MRGRRDRGRLRNIRPFGEDDLEVPSESSMSQIVRKLLQVLTPEERELYRENAKRKSAGRGSLKPRNG